MWRSCKLKGFPKKLRAYDLQVVAELIADAISSTNDGGVTFSGPAPPAIMSRFSLAPSRRSSAAVGFTPFRRAARWQPPTTHPASQPSPAGAAAKARTGRELLP